MLSAASQASALEVVPTTDTTMLKFENVLLGEFGEQSQRTARSLVHLLLDLIDLRWRSFSRT